MCVENWIGAENNLPFTKDETALYAVLFLV